MTTATATIETEGRTVHAEVDPASPLAAGLPADPAIALNLDEARVPRAMREQFRALPEDVRYRLSAAIAADPIGAFADQHPRVLVEHIADTAIATAAQARAQLEDRYFYDQSNEHAAEAFEQAWQPVEQALLLEREAALSALEAPAAAIDTGHARDRAQAEPARVTAHREAMQARASADDLAIWLSEQTKGLGVDDHALAVAAVEELHQLKQNPPKPSKDVIAAQAEAAGHAMGAPMDPRGGRRENKGRTSPFSRGNEVRAYEAQVAAHQARVELLERHVAASTPERVHVARQTLAAIAEARAGKHAVRWPW